MKPFTIALPFLAAALAGCESAPAPGLGWSRAPDLSAYSAMIMYSDIARQRAVLCDGSRTEWVENKWRDDFGARADAVTAALVARYGEEAVREAEATAIPTRRVGCEDAYILHWRDNYHRMLRLLETRLGLAWRFGNSPDRMAGSERISESPATLATNKSSVPIEFEVRSERDAIIRRTSNSAH